MPYKPADMASSAKEAYDAGAAIVHIHFREQNMGLFPSWDPDLAADVVDRIREACPGMIVNLTTGVVGEDISGPTACLERVKPEMAAMNSGSQLPEAQEQRQMGVASDVVRQPHRQDRAVLKVIRQQHHTGM
ncbi:MAG: 3-keto-5-aminohexanoate cleavage protein [bacterium]